ncbi:MAG: hypothetical protein AUH69_02695 [Actinobacteria bacterium 13_1_40CM_4_65_12]|nr:MAG: hypothetical protein AUH69_02695 [Actinobacteria bacterium 13_1_40CM_4_65_12]
MNSIRKLVGIGTGASALCVMALVVASASVLAHASDQTVREAASARTLATAEAAPSADCIAARQAIATARTDDRAEDASEKLDPAADLTEDQKERAAMKALWVTARGACGDQPKPAEPNATSAAAATPGCASAKTNLMNALAQEKAHEMSEKGTTAEFSTADRQEDQAEFAAIKSLWQTAATACGFNFEHFEGHSK